MSICELVKSFVMFVTQTVVVFLKLGLGDSMEPEFMIWISVIGWPVVTALLIGMDIIRKNLLKSKNNPL